MNIEEMIFNGASEEEIQKALNQIKAEKARQEAALREKNDSTKEELKKEARAHMINAFLAYLEAFDLLPEGEEIDEDDIQGLEQLIIKAEDMLPLYYKIAKLQNEINEIGKDEDFGLFGLGGRF